MYFNITKLPPLRSQPQDGDRPCIHAWALQYRIGPWYSCKCQRCGIDMLHSIQLAASRS